MLLISAGGVPPTGLLLIRDEGLEGGLGVLKTSVVVSVEGPATLSPPLISEVVNDFKTS